ncbi:hypothetical protein Misp03_83150 [Microbispora sp. NBRC 16548]|nr:hypothetical protein Misp03_83150 [Microbispora sp. NBRC 16548]
MAEIREPYDIAVDDDYPTLADGAESQLRLVWHPELAHHDHIQRRAERLGHLVRHRHPTPGQPQDDHILSSATPAHFVGEPYPRIMTIKKHTPTPGTTAQAAIPRGRRACCPAPIRTHIPPVYRGGRASIAESAHLPHATLGSPRSRQSRTPAGWWRCPDDAGQAIAATTATGRPQLL